MIRKLAKGLGLAAVLAGGIGLFVYFDKLKIEGEPLLSTCWAVDIIDDVTGEKVVGAEDLDFDPTTGTIFLSAYDRRAVDRELVAGGPVTTQGGIYTLMLSDVQQTGVLPVHDISRAFKEAGNEFRPHGMYLALGGQLIGAINRINFGIETDEPRYTVIDHFLRFEKNWGTSFRLEEEGVCEPYDYAILVDGENFTFFITDLDGSCRGKSDETLGSVKEYSDAEVRPLLEDLHFPNGIILTRNYLAVTETRNDAIHFLNLENKVEEQTVDLSMAPDNLTVDADDNLYVAGFPNLLDYYFYMSELLGVEKSPSAAYQIAPESYEQTLLFKDDGSLISGATVALRAGDYLILGSAWDDHIAICSGMDSLDG